MQIIIQKLKALKEAAWKLQVRDFNSRRFARRYAEKTKGLIREGIALAGEEVEETEKMARSFFRLLASRLDLEGRTEPPGEEEVRAAIDQLKDVGRFSVFATLVVLPGGLVSLLGLELLARKFGIREFTLVPSSFRKRAKTHLPAKPDPDPEK
jgi:hypothetical protein